MKKIVIALGGNALQSKNGPSTAEGQLEVVKKTCEYIAQVCKMGHQIAVVHGNGPQVGRILLSSETAKNVVPAMPFDVCGAMSQGYIGYHIQQSLRQSLEDANCAKNVVTLVTQVVVDSNDPGFSNPTKPIGPFYTEEEAKQISVEKGYTVKEDAGRGWRRVVASPIPQRIVEIDAVKQLWENTVVITCGGGGVPVAEDENGRLSGVAAVIDKDFAAALLANELDADMLVILTEVEKVAINFNKPNQQNLDYMSSEQAKKYIEEGHFAPGSMLPKVRAAMNFIEHNPKGKAIITSLDKVLPALEGRTGTVIENR